MPGKGNWQLATLRVEPKLWKRFLKICTSKDLTGSQVLRDYINLIATEKLSLLDKKVRDRTMTH